MLQEVQRDKLRYYVYRTRDEMGAAAAKCAAEAIKILLGTYETINMIFAAAPSQNEVLSGLVADKSIEWGRIRAFHMDEYLGLAEDAPQRFSRYLDNAVFSKINFLEVHYISGRENAVDEYASLLEKYPPHLVCMGIGENGHIAFNDPPVADFEDKKLVKIVELDEACRRQQVNDKCFEHFDDVPRYAVTLTIPALLSAKYIVCTVPGINKANAVRDALYGAIDESCPASILRKHPNTSMFLDVASASLLRDLTEE